MRPPRTSSRTVSSAARRSSEPHSSWTVASSRRRASAGRRVRALVELAQDTEHARELVDRRAPARLGGVRGHHEPKLGVARAPRRARPRWCRRRAGPTTTWRSEPARGRSGSAASRARSRRTRSLSSARLTSWNHRVSERTSTSVSSRVRPATSSASRSAARSSPRRASCPSATASSSRRRRVGAVAHRDHLAQDVGEQRLVGGEVSACGGEGHAADVHRRERAAPPRAALTITATSPQRLFLDREPDRELHLEVRVLVDPARRPGGPGGAPGPGPEHMAQSPPGAAAQGQPAAGREGAAGAR